MTRAGCGEAQQHNATHGSMTQCGIFQHDLRPYHLILLMHTVSSVDRQCCKSISMTNIAFGRDACRERWVSATMHATFFYRDCPRERSRAAKPYEKGSTMSKQTTSDLLARLDTLTPQELKRYLVHELTRKKLGLVWEADLIERDAAV